MIPPGPKKCWGAEAGRAETSAPKERKDLRLWSRGMSATECSVGTMPSLLGRKAAELSGQLAGLVEESALGQ